MSKRMIPDIIDWKNLFNSYINIEKDKIMFCELESHPSNSVDSGSSSEPDSLEIHDEQNLLILGFPTKLENCTTENIVLKT